MIGGCSVLLDGVDDYVDLGTVAARNFTTSDFTLLAWIYPVSLADGDRVLNHGAPFNHGYCVRLRADGTLWCSTSQSGVEQTTMTAAGAIVTGRWQHVAMVRAGSVVKIYVDGEDATLTAASHVDPATYSSTTILGANHTGTGNFFEGAIDEPAFFNAALSQQKIRELMRLSISASEPGIVSLHHLDDGGSNYATTTAVAAVSGVNGSLQNGATWVFDRWAPWLEPRVSATGSLAVSSDTAAQVPGTLRRFIPRVASRVLLSPIFDFELTTAGAGSILGLVRVNGTALTPQAIVAAPAGTPLLRLPLAQAHAFDWSAETLYSVDLAARLNDAADAIRGTLAATHTGYAISAQPIDGTW